MHYLNGSYTGYFNRINGRSGHLFQGRYKAIVIDIDHYLLELIRYLHLNPVRAGLVKRPEEYGYSSYRWYIGIGKKDGEGVYRDQVWGMLTGDKRRAAQKYKEFVEEGMKKEYRSPLRSVYGGAILGGEEFIREVLGKGEGRDLRSEEISCRRQLKTIRSMEEMIHGISSYFRVLPNKILGEKGVYRDIGIYLGKRYTGLTNREIGEKFGGLSYSGVTRAFQRFGEKMVKDRNLRRQVEEIGSRLSNVKG